MGWVLRLRLSQSTIRGWVKKNAPIEVEGDTANLEEILRYLVTQEAPIMINKKKSMKTSGKRKK